MEFIERREKVDSLLGKLKELARSGLIEMQETMVAKPAQLSKPKTTAALEHLKIEGPARMMRIFLSEEDRWKNTPLYEALVEAMRANDIAGVTVYRGILGYGARWRVHKDKPLLSSHHGSVMLSAITRRRSCVDFFRWWSRWFYARPRIERGLIGRKGTDHFCYQKQGQSLLCL